MNGRNYTEAVNERKGVVQKIVGSFQHSFTEKGCNQLQKGATVKTRMKLISGQRGTTRWNGQNENEMK